MASEHKEIYWKHFGYVPGDFIASEISGKPAHDVHAIIFDGMGGRKEDTPIELLISLTRTEHEKFGHALKYRPWLIFRHLKVLQKLTPDYQIKEEFIKY